ncbi:MAG: ubiquinone/menaquinone biosynthesis methyltransferase [Elusimicrobia bacterium]|nr:ubiquinone/menaquinone biosynthesis methyltransferase [Candidatus Obscuribacterium magneticum]
MAASSIRDIFDNLVPGYDQFNSLSSLGFVSHWRREAACLFPTGSFVLDVGTGTGGMAKELARRGCRVVGVDFSERMIQRAKQKLGNHPSIEFAVAAADALPFDSAMFDGITSAFVLRNLYEGGIFQQSLCEFHRVLRPGGQMVHLELTRPPGGTLSLGHRFYLRMVLPLIGRAIFGSRWPRAYLRSTIEKLPSPETICQWLRWGGFDQIGHTPLNGGVAALFVSKKCST